MDSTNESSPTERRMERSIRFCGVDCTQCGTYQGYLAGETGGLVNPDTQYRCCWLPRDYPEGRDCPIRVCCEDKGLTLCGECAQFEVCATLREFYDQPGYCALRQRVREIIAGKELGSRLLSVER